jgi:hypothetical protein
VLSIGSALASIAQGSAQAAALEDQGDAGHRCRTTRARARDAQERASLAEEYADLTSEQAAVQLANGLNPGVGTPASVRAGDHQIRRAQPLGQPGEHEKPHDRRAGCNSRSLS